MRTYTYTDPSYHKARIAQALRKPIADILQTKAVK